MVVELLKDPPADAVAKPDSGAERRRSRRHAVTLPATMTRAAAEGDAPARVEVRVRDISLHGAGVRSDVPLASDETYFLDIGAGLLKLHARVRVVSTRLRRDGSWDVGTSFVTAG